MKTKKPTARKRYTIYYSQKGGVGDLGYIANCFAKNVTDAKELARSEVWRMMRTRMGTMQLNKFMKQLKFYTK